MAALSMRISQFRRGTQRETGRERNSVVSDCTNGRREAQPALCPADCSDQKHVIQRELEDVRAADMTRVDRGGRLEAIIWCVSQRERNLLLTSSP